MCRRAPTFPINADELRHRRQARPRRAFVCGHHPETPNSHAGSDLTGCVGVDRVRGSGSWTMGLKRGELGGVAVPPHKPQAMGQLLDVLLTRSASDVTPLDVHRDREGLLVDPDLRHRASSPVSRRVEARAIGGPWLVGGAYTQGVGVMHDARGGWRWVVYREEPGAHFPQVGDVDGLRVPGQRPSWSQVVKVCFCSSNPQVCLHHACVKGENKRKEREGTKRMSTRTLRVVPP